MNLDLAFSDETKKLLIEHKDLVEKNLFDWIKEQVESDSGPINFKKLLESYNQIRAKATNSPSRITAFPSSTKQKFKARMTDGFTKQQIHWAMINAFGMSYHKENNFMYLTLSFFSRAETLEKYGYQPIKKMSKNVNAPIKK